MNYWSIMWNPEQQTTGLQKIYVTYITDKALVPLLHKGLWKLEGKIDNLMEKSARDTDSSQKRKWKWPLNIWKDTQHRVIRDRLIKTITSHLRLSNIPESDSTFCRWQGRGRRLPTLHVAMQRDQAWKGICHHLGVLYVSFSSGWQSCFCEFILKWQ